MATTVAPLTTVVMGSVDGRHAGLAAGISNTVSRLGALLSIAAMGILLLGVFDSGLERRLAELNVPHEARRALVAQRDDLAAIEIPAGLDPRTRAAVRRAIDASFVDGFRAVMIAAALLAGGGALGGAVLIEGRRRRPGRGARGAGRPSGGMAAGPAA
jgi:hypothetical protein